LHGATGVGVGATGVGVGVPQVLISDIVTSVVLSEPSSKHGVVTFSFNARLTLYAPPPHKVPVTVIPPDASPVIEYILHIIVGVVIVHLSKNHRVP
jgi:hypothetical protein